jgi:hypothetical protein
LAQNIEEHKKGESKVFLYMTAALCSILVFIMGFVENFYLKLAAKLYFYIINEIWLPLVYTILQDYLGTEKQISGIAVFFFFESLSACASSILVGYLIENLNFKTKELQIQFSIFPLMSVALIFSAISSYFI